MLRIRWVHVLWPTLPSASGILVLDSSECQIVSAWPDQCKGTKSANSEPVLPLRNTAITRLTIWLLVDLLQAMWSIDSILSNHAESAAEHGLGPNCMQSVHRHVCLDMNHVSHIGIMSQTQIAGSGQSQEKTMDMLFQRPAVGKRFSAAPMTLHQDVSGRHINVPSGTAA